MALAVVILAAGQGTRMNSKKQKILHEVGGKPMVQHIFEAAAVVADTPPVLVVGPGEGGVQALFGEKARYVVQEEQLGTGHATMVAQPLLQSDVEQVIVTYGDMPLLRSATLAKLARAQRETGAAIAMLSVLGEAESSFGRVLRDANDRVTEIVEVSQAQRRPNAADLLAIRELNAGVYCFDGHWLWGAINRLPLRQARSGQEYYLTDMVSIAAEEGRLVEALLVEDGDECLGAGTRAELAIVEKAFRRRANHYWLEHGVTLVDPNAVYIDPDVVIGQDTLIWPNTFLQGRTHIGEGCVIGPNTIIRNSRLGAGCRIEQAVVENGNLADHTEVKPFTWISGHQSA